LREEATPHLPAAITLQVNGTLENLKRLPSKYVPSIERALVMNTESVSKAPLQLDMLSALKTLELRNITVWCKYHDEAYLQSQEGDECMIALALFNLGRISSRFTVLLTDTTRPYNILLCCQFVVSSMTDETIVWNAALTVLVGNS